MQCDVETLTEHQQTVQCVQGPCCSCVDFSVCRSGHAENLKNNER